MKTLSLFFLLALFLAAPARAQDLAPVNSSPYVLYAQFTKDTTVELSDGSQWAMDSGDCFPIYMFKEQQTKVVLQLGSATFYTEASRVRVMKESEKAAALVSYRKNLDSFVKARTDRWKKEAK